MIPGINLFPSEPCKVYFLPSLILIFKTSMNACSQMTALTWLYVRTHMVPMHVTAKMAMKAVERLAQVSINRVNELQGMVLNQMINPSFSVRRWKELWCYDTFGSIHSKSTEASRAVSKSCLEDA